MVTKKPDHQEEREGIRKTIARGMPDVSGVTVVTMLVCFFILRTRLRAQRAPGIPCALLRGGTNVSGKTRTRNTLRECEAVFENEEADANSVVMPGLDPGIHDFLVPSRRRRGMAGSSPAMTVTVVSEDALRAFARP
jgi:hypothetical protein